MTGPELIAAYAAGKRDFIGAVLIGANLSGADLRGADLRCADLRDAKLRGADQRDANLVGANLTGADLSGAKLTGANLSCADLTGADLRDANLTGAVLIGANLTGADLRGAKLRGIPVVPDLEARIAAEIAARPEALNMGAWHCGTTHCRAGWAITFAGEAGSALEAEIGSSAAGALIYHASCGYVPDFFADDETARADILARGAAK